MPDNKEEENLTKTRKNSKEQKRGSDELFNFLLFFVLRCDHTRQEIKQQLRRDDNIFGNAVM